MQDTWVPSLGRADPLEKEMATHSSILAWRIPWTEGPGRLQSMGLQESWMWLKRLSSGQFSLIAQSRPCASTVHILSIPISQLAPPSLAVSFSTFWGPCWVILLLDGRVPRVEGTSSWILGFHPAVVGHPLYEDHGTAYPPKVPSVHHGANAGGAPSACLLLRVGSGLLCICRLVSRAPRSCLMAVRYSGPQSPGCESGSGARQN